MFLHSPVHPKHRIRRVGSAVALSGALLVAASGFRLFADEPAGEKRPAEEAKKAQRQERKVEGDRVRDGEKKSAEAKEAQQAKERARVDEETAALEKSIAKLKAAAEEMKDQPEARAALEKTIEEYRKKIAEARAKGELRKPDAGRAPIRGFYAMPIDQLRANMAEMMKSYEKQLAELGEDGPGRDAIRQAMKNYEANMQKLMKQLAEMPNPPMFQFQQLPMMRFDVPNTPFVDRFGFQQLNATTATGRLGVLIEPVSPVLADQLGLAENQGVVVSFVREGTPATKAGLKRHDIILAINDKAVNAQDVAKVVEGLPAEKEFTMTILRKGKKETITGTTPTAPKRVAKPVASSSMSVSISGDQFQIQSQQGDQSYSIKGTVGDTDNAAIEIREGEKAIFEGKGLKNVPEDHREAVEKLLKSVAK